MARPRKPTAVLEATGAFKKDPQRRRDRKAEPEFTKGAECPKHLKGTAREAWVRLAEALDEAGVLRRPHAEALAGACVALGHAIDADELISREGYLVTVVTKAGSSQRLHPAVSLSLRAWDSFRRFCQEFGLTPASAARLVAESTPRQTLDEVLSADTVLPDLEALKKIQ